MGQLLDSAIRHAVTAHRGQLDKNGQPYILHPLRVMLAMPADDEVAQAIAVLHDVVEDTNITLKNLRDWGFPDEVVEGVDAMTKRPGERYHEDFIVRLRRHPKAKIVKREGDILDNMRPVRLALLDDATVARLVGKYNRALDMLR